MPPRPKMKLGLKGAFKVAVPVGLCAFPMNTSCEFSTWLLFSSASGLAKLRFNAV